MALKGHSGSLPYGPVIPVRMAFVMLFAILVGAQPTGPATAYLLSDDSALNPCRAALSTATPDQACDWTFESIARIRTEKPSRSQAPADAGRMERAGFATSDLTIEETVTALTAGTSLLSWDREVGIADELTASMEVSIDASALRSTQFLLMPATFNEAFLADFVDFEACATAHTFIFSGALDGRSDAPYVTNRWAEMKVNVCLDIAGADCSRFALEVEPARLYFHSDWPCRYWPRRSSIGSRWSEL